MTPLDAIRAEAARRGETLAQAVRHHMIEGVIARVARSPEGASFVLRGGILTRAWVAPRPRPTRDLDFVGDFAFDVDDTARRFRGALDVELDDGVRLERWSANGIWLDSEFPGVRITLAIGLGRADEQLGIDIGFRDPLVPAATTIAIRGEPVRAVRPETQLAWKLHCLAEMGDGWRPKDLADLWLIVHHAPLVLDELPPALDAAFTSRGYTLDAATSILDAPRWSTKTARLRWQGQRASLPELAEVVAAVRACLAPALAVLAQEVP